MRGKASYLRLEFTFINLEEVFLTRMATVIRKKYQLLITVEPSTIELQNYTDRHLGVIAGKKIEGRY